MKKKLVVIVLAMALALSGSMVALAGDTKEETEGSSDKEIEIETEEFAKENKSVIETTEEKDSDTEKLEDKNAEEENPNSQDTTVNRAGEVLIDAGHFPDANFREYVKTNFDTDGNGSLSQDEIDAVKEITLPEYLPPVAGEKIDITGIEYFVSLEKLNCSGKGLTRLDISKNLNLRELDCSRCYLGSLDVSKNIKLEKLICEFNELGRLDVSNNPNLQELLCLNCELSALDVSKNIKLCRLECGQNSLRVLDVSNNVNLQQLICRHNQLESLDISKNISLEVLTCNQNQLKSLDISKNSNLGVLACDNNKLKNLDISENVNLYRLQCRSNQLSSLDVSNNIKLTWIECVDNPLGSLDLSNNVNLITDSWNLEEISYSTFNISSTVVNEDGIWKSNLASIIGKENLDRVTIETPGARLLSDGTVVFSGSAMPTELKYIYDTRLATLEVLMHVEVALDEGNGLESSLRILPEVTDNTHVIGTPEGATIVCTGELKDFVSVLVDDELVDRSNYTLAEGSTILTFTAKYLDTLSVGRHKVTLNYTYASIDTELRILDAATTDTNTSGSANNTNVTQNTDSVNTGDNAPIMSWIIIALLSVGTCAGVLGWRKRMI